MGASLSKPVLCTVLERHGSKYFKVGLAEMNGWRNNMEDAHVVHVNEPGEGYFGILDGHGGADCSEWCAKRLHEVLAVQGCPKGDAAAKKLVLDTDREFFEQGLTGGSTAAMCVVRHPTAAGGKFGIHVINAGDSRVLLSRASGAIVEGPGTDGGLTTDHKPGHPDERARIERCGGTVESALGGVLRVNGELSVSRGFGDGDHKKTGGPAQEDRPVTCSPEMGHFECDASDFVIIVCDGVSEGDFPNSEVCQLAARVLTETGGDAAKAAEAVCFRAVETESKDNISCMIVLLGGAPAEGAAAPIVMGKAREFKAGPLLGSGDAGFVKAYVAMCGRGGVSFAAAAQQRHATLVARRGTPQAQGDDEDELAMFGEPAGAPGSAERAAWFEEWARAKEEGGGGDEGDGGMGGVGGGPGGPAAQQQAMMKMLLGMMQGADGPDGMGKGKGGGGPGPGRGGGRGMGAMGRGRGR